MKLIKKGAEGDLYLTTWNKQKSILKIRKKKVYRNLSLMKKYEDKEQSGKLK